MIPHSVSQIDKIQWKEKWMKKDLDLALIHDIFPWDKKIKIMNHM